MCLPWLLGSTEQRVAHSIGTPFTEGNRNFILSFNVAFTPCFESLNAYVTWHKPPKNHLWIQTR